MVHRRIEDIDLPDFLWRQVNPIHNIKPNRAFDTETSKGGCFLISDSNGRYVNNRDFKDLYGLLTYLNHRDYRNTINWFYNLEYDTNAILHFLSFEDRDQIAEFNTVDYEDFRVDIIPKKELKISKIVDDKPKNSTFFYDLAQFYNFKRLAILAEQTNYAKVVVDDISQINVEKYYSDRDYHKLINDRCIIDCKITVELADKFTNNINKVVGINNYRSNASIARRYILENISHNLRMPSTKFLDVALKSYHAGHIETCSLGRMQNIHNYDINSAYPFNIANLYETNGSMFVNKEYEPDTAYSFYNVDLDYYNEFLSPWWLMKPQGNYHVNGKLDTWIGKPEIEFLIKFGYDFDIIKGYHMKKLRFAEQPFKEAVEFLYNERMKAKDNKDEIQLVYKIILNSIYGVTLNTINKKVLYDYGIENDNDLFREVNGEIRFYKQTYKATNMYNPVYGSEITANTRMKLFTDFYKYLKYIISVNTDGVYLINKNNGVKISKKLGDYSYKNLKDLMIVGSGRYFLLDDNGNVVDKESRFRSIPKSPTEIYDMMQTNRNKNSLEVTREKPIKLKESVKQQKYHDKFNEFRSVTKQIHFNTDKRMWFDEFKNIGETMDKTITSRPFKVDELKHCSKRTLKSIASR